MFRKGRNSSLLFIINLRPLLESVQHRWRRNLLGSYHVNKHPQQFLDRCWLAATVSDRRETKTDTDGTWTANPNTELNIRFRLQISRPLYKTPKADSDFTSFSEYVSSGAWRRRKKSSLLILKVRRSFSTSTQLMWLPKPYKYDMELLVSCG